MTDKRKKRIEREKLLYDFSSKTKSKIDLKIEEKLRKKYYGKDYRKRDFDKYIAEISLCLTEQYPSIFRKINRFLFPNKIDVIVEVYKYGIITSYVWKR